MIDDAKFKKAAAKIVHKISGDFYKEVLSTLEKQKLSKDDEVSFLLNLVANCLSNIVARCVSYLGVEGGFPPMIIEQVKQQIVKNIENQVKMSLDNLNWNENNETTKH